MSEPWTFRFAERMEGVKTSKIRELFDAGRQRPDAIDLSIGQADFDVPTPIREATVAAIEEGCGGYSTTEGYADVVAAATAHLQADFGLDPAEKVMMTSGASGALTLAFLALLDRGDEVLLPDPYFVLYPTLARIAGATPVFYDLYPDFRLRPEALLSKITDNTRVLVLNSPANPSGMCLRPDELATVAAICRERRIAVVSDELYHQFSFEEPHSTIKDFLGPEALLIGGTSKAFGMAGWRLGWAAGSAELIDRLRTLQQFTFTCPPTLVQRGALAAFSIDLTPRVEAFRAKRDFLYDGLVDAGYEAVKPNGSYYVFPKVPWGDDVTFIRAAIDRGLLIVPGRAFSTRTTHFRVTYARDMATLERGMEVLRALAKEPPA
ncbi:MAG: aminotransferase class I/II-fold pyridoxal phosphate-dependent enzyme [Proteobacteria bacterium]|nr:aminotransferase class I/II-fold pyridoxal phosphate-dependent enzyme [Pseudomonadota bacterium]